MSYKPGGRAPAHPERRSQVDGAGWTKPTCEATTQVGTNDMGSDPGTTRPTAARPSSQLEGHVLAGGEVKVPFPVFDVASGTGANGSFNIIGYATFKIWGWKFWQQRSLRVPNAANDPGMNSALACSGGNDRCIIGQFVQFTVIGSGTVVPGGLTSAPPKSDSSSSSN